MAFPPYVTMENVYFNGTLTPCAVLLGGDPKWLIVYDTLDIVSQQDLDTLVAANGGTLPLTSVDVAHNTMLPNGSNWYDTYDSVTLFVGSTGPTPPPDNIPPATSTTIGGVIVQSNSGLAVDMAGHVSITPATDTVLGGVSIPANSGLLIDSNGAVTIDPSFITSDVSWAHVKIVSTSGDDSTATGSFAKPYLTIAAGVNAAASNDWVYILPGVYNEIVTLGSKPTQILGITNDIEFPSIEIAGLVLSGSNPVFFQNIGIIPSGTNAIEVHQVNHVAGFRGNNVVVRVQDDAHVALVTDASDGAWTGSLTMDNFYVNGGQINIGVGSKYVSIRSMPQDSTAVVNMTGGTLDLVDVWGLNQINHSGGLLFGWNFKRLAPGISGTASIISTASAAAGNALIINNANLVADNGIKGHINKTGLAPYTIMGVSRNLGVDTLTGTVLTEYLTQYGQDIVAGYTAVNYGAINSDSLYAHLAAIDTKLGQSGTGDVSSVNAKTGSIVIAAGTNVTIDNSGASIVINGTEVFDEGSYQ